MFSCVLILILGLVSVGESYCPSTRNAQGNWGENIDCVQFGRQCYTFDGEVMHQINTPYSSLGFEIWTMSYKSQRVTVTGCYDNESQCSDVLIDGADTTGYDGRNNGRLVYGGEIVTECWYSVTPAPQVTCAECYKNLLQLGSNYYDQGDTCTAMMEQSHLYSPCAAGQACMYMKLILAYRDQQEYNRIFVTVVGCSDRRETETDKCVTAFNSLPQNLKNMYSGCTVGDVSELRSWAY